MLSSSEVLEFLDQNRKEIESFGVSEIGVFGSVSRGENDESSDVDLLVEFNSDEKTYRNFIDLKRFLEEELGRDIDLVTRSSIKKSMREQILEEVQYGKEA